MNNVNEDLLRELVILRDQIKLFAQQYGEADFYIGGANEAIANALAARAMASAPPQGVMLTDEEIDDITDQHNTGRAQGDYDFARAIERAVLSKNAAPVRAGDAEQPQQVQAAEQLVAACAPFLKEGETPAGCIERNRKDAALVFDYYNDAVLWRKVRDLLGEIEQEFVRLEDLPGWIRKMQDQLRAARAAARLAGPDASLEQVMDAVADMHAEAAEQPQQPVHLRALTEDEKFSLATDALGFAVLSANDRELAYELFDAAVRKFCEVNGTPLLDAALAHPHPALAGGTGMLVKKDEWEALSREGQERLTGAAAQHRAEQARQRAAAAYHEGRARIGSLPLNGEGDAPEAA